MKILPLLMLFAWLTGCATNPYAQFYRDYTKQMPIAIQQRLLPPTQEPQVLSAPFAKHREEGQRLEERGFVVIGEAGFRGGAPTQQQLAQHAKTVGAEVVLFSSEFSHTAQGVAPLFTYRPSSTSTTTHYGTVNANTYGSGGYAYGSANYSGYSTTTTPGTLQTQYVPYQRQVYDYEATFWRRIKPGIFGAQLSPIPDSLRATLQRNTGAHIEFVTLDSPAFRANILRGDVVIQLAEKPVATVEEFIGLLPTYAGQRVPVWVIRGEQTIEIEVLLNPQP